MAGGGANMGGVSSTGYGQPTQGPFSNGPMAGGDTFIPTDNASTNANQTMGTLFGLSGSSAPQTATPIQQGYGPNVDQAKLGEMNSWLRGTPTQAPPQTDQINDLYQNVLGRQADQGGHDFWTNAMLSGTSIDDIKKQMMSSPEYQTNQIKGMYQNLLGREADQSGLDFWSNAAKQGSSLDAIRNQIMQSGEYQKLHPAQSAAETTAATTPATTTAATTAATPVTTTPAPATVTTAPATTTTAAPTAPVYNTPVVSQSGGIGSGGAMNYQYRRGGIAALVR